MDGHNENNGQRRVLFVPNQQFISFQDYSHFNFVHIPQNHLPYPRFYPMLSLDQDLLARIELERSISLVQFMADEGVVPSREDEIKRKNVIARLKQIVMIWIEKIAHKRHLPQRHINNTSATIITYGSYGLGVHTPESDIDALCVAPYYATMESDFFIILRKELETLKEVSDLQCIKGAKVPSMRFKFDGISVDLPYAQLPGIFIHENVDILDPYYMRDINESNWRALSGVRANQTILQHVSNVPHFRSILRCVKLWAKRRGVYGHLFGFFGGVHWAILASFISLRHPNVSLTVAVAAFFQTFDNWQWPTPVILYSEIIPSTACISLKMPIQLPSSPGEFCQSNITKSTQQKIQEEIHRGHMLTKDWLKNNFDWKTLFQPFPYTDTYKKFIQLRISACDQVVLRNWKGWVKSRFRLLLLKLEAVQCMCDPNPTEYIDSGLEKPNVVFYWGLYSDVSNYVHMPSIAEDFKKKLGNGFQNPHGEFTLSIVEANQVITY